MHTNCLAYHTLCWNSMHVQLNVVNFLTQTLFQQQWHMREQQHWNVVLAHIFTVCYHILKTHYCLIPLICPKCLWYYNYLVCLASISQECYTLHNHTMMHYTCSIYRSTLAHYYYLQCFYLLLQPGFIPAGTSLTGSPQCLLQLWDSLLQTIHLVTVREMKNMR